MKFHLIAVGSRMPTWVQEGYDEYAKRLPRECPLLLNEINAGRRSRNEDPARAIAEEGRRMLAALPGRCHVVALDEHGSAWSTQVLAENLRDWMALGQDVALLVGGPDGLSEDCRSRAQQTWSLSALTLPHPMVRVLLAEQLYRAWSLLKGHPYHRA